MTSNSSDDKKLDEAIQVAKAIIVDKCRESFWFYCKKLAPDFYIEGRTHLKIMCDTLQEFYEGTLVDKAGKPYKKLLLQMPPRHGKSRTLFMFAAWMLGKEHTNKIITASYNDILAQSFSKYTRNVILAEKTDPTEWVYSDIFDAKIKYGDASASSWALEGQFFNYRGTGLGGTLTGTGSNFLIIDDPVKDAETAYNETALDKIWQWYTGTFISRGEHALQVLCQTPWSSKDLGGRLLASEGDLWYKLSMPACDKQGNMLCDDILTHDEYLYLKDHGDESIIAANYDMIRLDVKGSLYGKGLQTYDTLPENIELEAGYIDTADEGDDYLCAIFGKKSGVDFYVTDVLFTQDPQEITEPQTVSMIQSSGTKEVQIESNNGGRGFARNVSAGLVRDGYACNVQWFHQGENKKARILTNAPVAKAHIFFPADWSKRWPEFYLSLITYQRVGKNKHDDSVDVVAGICEKFLVQQATVFY